VLLAGIGPTDVDVAQGFLRTENPRSRRRHEIPWAATRDDDEAALSSRCRRTTRPGTVIAPLKLALAFTNGPIQGDGAAALLGLKSSTPVVA
jgi:hypothetical protein